MALVASVPMSDAAYIDDRGRVGHYRGVGLILLLVLLPIVLTGLFYFYEQSVVQRRVVVHMSDVQAPPSSLLLQLERNDGAQRKYQYISGWVVQTSGTGWLKPSVLIVAPDGRATEFRANLRKRGDLTQLAVNEQQQNVAGFEVRVKKRYFPSGNSLKIVLAVTQQGRRILVDTGATVQGGHGEE